MKREFFLVFIVAIFSFYLISSHIVTPTTLSVNPNESYPYTIIINNTDIGQNANVTQVNITLPSSFTFIEDSNITTASFETFINDSNILSWTNSSSEGYLVNGSDTENFQFNANAPTLGDYNLTITVVNLTGNFEYNISITIEDTTSPTINFRSPTPNSNSNIAQTFIPVKVEADDNIAIDTITIFIYSSAGLLSSSKNDTSPFSLNFTGLTDGVYTINATVNDTSGNEGITARTITLNASGNATAPTNATCTPNWNCVAWAACANNIQIRTCADSNACNSSFLVKNESQSCGTTCTPNWDCSDWEPEECSGGEIQERTCTDLNNCGLTKPVEKISCDEEGGSKFWVITILLIIVGVLFLVGIIFFLRGKSSGEPSLYGRNNKRIPPSGPSTPLGNYSRGPMARTLARTIRRPPMVPPRAPRRPIGQRPGRMARRPPPRRGNFQNKPL